MVWTLLEILGLVLVIAFCVVCVVVWWPVVLLVTGVLLLAFAQLGEQQTAVATAAEEAAE